MSSAVANKAEMAEDQVDREKICPLLLRVFINNNSRHHHINEYTRGNVPSKEVQIYTWMDATLKELTSLVKEVNQECRKHGSRFDFALVFPDMRAASYRMREIGSTINGRKEADDLKTLAQSRFQIGDYLDVAISIPSNESGPRSGGLGDRGSLNSRGSRGFNGDRDFGGGGGGGGGGGPRNRDRDFGPSERGDFGRSRDFGGGGGGGRRGGGRPY